MKVEYTLTLEDAAAFFRYQLRRGARAKGRSRTAGWIWFIVLAVLMLLLLALKLTIPRPFTLGGLDIVVLSFFALYALLFFFTPAITLRTALKSLRGNTRFLERRTLIITPHAITTTMPSGLRTTFWHAVEDVVEHEDHAFFYIAKAEAFILPRAVFADDFQFEEFLDTARRYHEEARRLVRTEGEA